MEANLSPDLEGTNSLLMNRPMGWEYLRPFGAVNWTETFDMMIGELWKSRRAGGGAMGEQQLRRRRTKDGEGRRISAYICVYVSIQPGYPRRVDRSIEQDNANDEWQPRAFCGSGAARLSTGPRSVAWTYSSRPPPADFGSRDKSPCVAALLGAGAGAGAAPVPAAAIGDWPPVTCIAFRTLLSDSAARSASPASFVMPANTTTTRYNDHDNDNPPDSLIDHSVSLQYWNSISPDVNGMLGGFPQISRIDLRGSANFLAKVRRLIPALSAAGPLKLGVDCGAGIGRVTDGFLSNACEVVDVVEPVDNFARVIRDGPLKEHGKVADIYTTGLESWMPAKRYDLFWNQWCLGHLTDAQLVDYLSRCKDALADGGLIVVKENISTDADGEDIYDEVDSSVTRTDRKYRALFKDAGLALVKTEEQSGFPSSLKLFPVRFYALRPAA